ncbi:MAG: universal stress protein UspA [Rhodocyclales bacterium GWA2_65_20]|nr:MAG: universal stress protein UspA [Rhodocyclales bacterium GWA2_65_20]
MKILLAIDGSEVSQRALASLVAHVRWFRDKPEVHLLHVHLPVPVGLAVQHVSQEALDRYYREEGEAVLAAARGRLEEAGLAVTQHIHVGHPAEIIVKLASELGCELICLGTHGRGAVAGVVLGSVAGKVLHLAQVPVLLAK